jgi:pimeloyl-ACP methyl ester carboxylesterase
VPVAAVALCNDSRDVINSEREWREAWQLTADAAPTLHGHFGFGSFCMGSSIATPNPEHRQYMEGAPLEGTPPILLMNSLHDPVTSYEEATNVASQIKDSVLLTYDGWGHVVYDRNDCTLTATNAYLLTGTLPATGTHCPAT